MLRKKLKEDGETRVALSNPATRKMMGNKIEGNRKGSISILHARLRFELWCGVVDGETNWKSLGRITDEISSPGHCDL